MDQQPFDKEKFNAVCEKVYKDQAIFFLNAFWTELSAEAANIWKVYQKFLELDNGNVNGKSVDEFNAHRLLEAFGQTMTVIAFREEMKKIDKNVDKRMGVVEYLVYRYKVQIKEMLARPQGTNEELEKANAELNKVLAEIDKIETEKRKLESDAAGEGFKATKAKNELAQLLSRDNLPLNKALIDAKLAVKKAQGSNTVAAQGAIWWVARELEEVAKYKPKSNLKTSFK